RQLQRARLQVEVHHAIVHFIQRRVIFPTQPEIQRQRWRDPPIVLAKESENISAQLIQRRSAAGVPVSPRNVAKPEVRQRRAGLRIDSEEAQSSVVARINVVLTQPHILKSRTEGVPTTRNCKVVFNLSLCRMEDLYQIAQAEVCIRPAAVPGDVDL